MFGWFGQGSVGKTYKVGIGDTLSLYNNRYLIVSIFETGVAYEDLLVLARSKLGQAILEAGDPPLQQITPKEELVLRRILARVQG